MTRALTRGRLPAAVVLAGALLAAGCGDGGPKTGDVTGTITVDGKVPADGSSITFIPSDGKAPSAGATLDAAGKYAVKVPVGTSKVEIRAPKPKGGGAFRPKAAGGGPGPGPTEWIEESLPAKYNDQTELTIEVKAGSQEKNWDLKTK